MWVCTPTRKTATVKAEFFLKRFGFVFWFDAPRQNYPTNEIGAFAHVSGAAEVTVKHTTWGRSNTKQSCRAHIRNDEEGYTPSRIYMPGRNKKMQGKMNVELLVSLVCWTQRTLWTKYPCFLCMISTSVWCNTCSLLLMTSECPEA